MKLSATVLECHYHENPWQDSLNNSAPRTRLKVVIRPEAFHGSIFVCIDAAMIIGDRQSQKLKIESE